MASIPKIFHSLEKKEMTLSEYEKYMNEHPYHSSIKAIRCVECGKLVLEKNKNARTKYCKDCANKKQQERNKENMRKSRATD